MEMELGWGRVSRSQPPAKKTKLAPQQVQTDEDEKPLFPFQTFPHILRHILSFLDAPSLKNCRGLSQLWDKEASPILGEKTIIILPSQYPPWAREGDLAKYEGIKKSSTLRPDLFENFQVFYYSLTKDVFKDLVQNSGAHFKSLKMVSEYRQPLLMEDDMERVQKILNVSCPNLRTLEVTLPLRILQGSGMIDNLVFPNPLMITTLKFDGFFLPKVSDFYVRLIKSCPQLTSLDFKCVFPMVRYGPSLEETDFCRLLQELSKLPLVTENLQEFSWRHATAPSWILQKFNMEILAIVSEMKFSKKLKKLSIGSSVDDLQVERRFLPKLLKNVGQFVEHLTFTGKYQLKEETGHSPNFAWNKNRINVPDFPEMPSVKFLSNQSKSDYGNIISPEFVGKVFPNLVKYVVERISHCKDVTEEMESIIKMFSELNDSLDTSKGDEDIRRIENLKSLVIFREVLRRTTLDKCIQFYPNLTDLVLVAGDELIRCSGEKGVKGWPQTQQVPYIFSQIEKLKSLKKLTYLHPYAGTCIELEQLCHGLKNIKNFEQLESLNIVNTREGTRMSFEGIKKGLDEMAGLKCALCLSRFHMPEGEVAEMMRYAKDNGIRLKWVDGEEEGPGRGYQLPRDSTYSNHEGSIVHIGWNDKWS